MDIVEVSKTRYTTKYYNPEKTVSPEQLDKLLSVLRNSPSSVNLQPWHFVVVDNRVSKDKILPAVTGFNHPRIIDSTYTLVFCIKDRVNEAYLTHLLDSEEKDGRFPNREIANEMAQARRGYVALNSKTEAAFQQWASRQLYIALGQFLFASSAIGVDSTPIEGFDSEKMDAILSLTERGLKSVVLATIGHRADNDSNASRPKSRLPREEIFTFI